MVRRQLLTAALSGLGAGLLGGCTPLAAFNAAAPRSPLAPRPVRDVAYGPGPRHRLDIYRPHSRGPAPVVVFFYGGSWEEGRRGDYAFAGRALAAKGFLTVVPDYRLTGEAPYPAFLQDCAQAVAWAADNVQAYGGDPQRLALAGHSAGAYNAAMLALDGRWLAEAGAPDGLVKAWAGLSGPYDFLPLSPGAAQRTFGRATDLAATQPIAHASAAAPPAFLAHGEADRLVMPRNTQRLAARLRELGVPVEEKLYPHAGHAELVLALAWPVSLRTPVLRDAAAFLRAHLTG